MKSISEIAKELNVNKHRISQIVLRKNIQPDSIGKNKVKLYDVEKENIIKKLISIQGNNIIDTKHTHENTFENTKHTHENTFENTEHTHENTFENTEHTHENTFENTEHTYENTFENTEHTHENTNLIQVLKEQIAQKDEHIQFLENQCNSLLAKYEDLLNQNTELTKTISSLQQTISSMQQSNVELQKTTLETVQALKNAQLLHAETMKTEILSLVDNSKKRHWWEFWKR